MKDLKHIELDFSVVIPAYNEESYLPATIDSLQKAMTAIPELRGELIVVDNHSTDLTAESARQLGARVVFEEARGIAMARNAGARVAYGKYLFFVDADTLVNQESLLQSLEYLLSGQVGAGGSVLEFDQTQGRFVFGVLLPRMWNFISRVFKLAAGSFVFTRRDLFWECGGFPQNLYAGEEIFFSRAVKRLCRKKGMSFEVLQDYPIITSSRKLLWYSNLRIGVNLMLLVLFPFAVRFRKLCGFWYQRP